MDGQYIYGGIVASLLGLFLFCISSRKKMSKASKKIQSNKTLKMSENGISRPDITGSTDVIIVGAGVAGSALAYTLGKDGWRVHVIERDLTEPNRIVGECLQPGGYLKLIDLGLEDCVNGIDAQMAFGCVFYKDGKSVKLPFPLESFCSDFAGRSFHNGRFVQSMREKTASLPNVRLEQGTVTSLLEEKGTIKGVQYQTKAGQELTAYAPLTIVCDGCFSNLRRSLSNSKVEIPSYSVGLVLENCDFPQYANYGHIMLTDAVILVYPISSNEFRCLVDVPAQKFPSISDGGIANYLKTVVAPQIPPELLNAFISAIDKCKIRTMPNRIMPESPCPIPGTFLMGDALNMRHPFTAGGMTVALSDVVVLRDLLRGLQDLSDADAICKYLKSFYTLRKPMASTIDTLAGALYQILSESPDPLQKELRQACFDYLSLGFSFSNGFMALFSGLKPSPFSLVFHFLAFTIYGVARFLLPFPSLKGLRIGARLILNASVISFLMTKTEVGRILFTLTVPAYYRAPPAKKKISNKEE